MYSFFLSYLSLSPHGPELIHVIIDGKTMHSHIPGHLRKTSCMFFFSADGSVSVIFPCSPVFS